MRTYLWVSIVCSLLALASVPWVAKADLAASDTTAAAQNATPTQQPAAVASPAGGQAPLGELSEIITKWSPLPFREIVVEDASLPAQAQETAVEGDPGLVAARYRVVYRDGIEVARIFVGEQVLRQPVDRIVRRAPGPEGPSRGLPFQARSLVMEATAYAPYGPDTNGVTATGVMAERGIAAVDPRVIPLGTRLYVEGYGYALAADTGGAIKGNRIDLCFESAVEVDRFGRREVRVYILP